MADPEPTDADLAALYGELDDAEPPPAWGSVRDLISAARADGFDEEPPAHLDALLLAAAAKHAPRPRQPWWRRAADWMRPVVMHPAMAAAMALLAVGAAAGVMYERGRVQVAQPRLPAREAAPTPSAPVGGAPDAPADGVSPTEVDKDLKSGSIEEAAANERNDEAATAPPPPPEAPTTPGKRRRPSATGSRGAVAQESGEAQAGGGGVATDSVPVDVADDVAPFAPGAGQAADRGPARPAVEPKVPALDPREDLLRQARAAALRGDCAAARDLARKASALDAAFYRSTFLRDRDLAVCLASGE